MMECIARIERCFDNLSLRKKLSITFVCMTVLPMVVAMGIAWQANERVLKQSVVERNTKIAHEIASELDFKIAEKIRMMKLIANSSDVRSMDANRQSMVLKEAARLHPDVQLIVMANKEGRQIARWDDKPVENINYMDREYYHRLLATKDTVVSDVLVAKSTGRPGVVVAEPVRADNGELLGLLIVNIDLEKLIQALNQAKIGRTGYAYVVNQSGKVIMNPDMGLILNGQDESALPPVEAVIKGRTGWTEYEANGKERLAAYSYAATAKWGIIAQQPMDEAMREVTDLKGISLLILLLSSVVAVGIAFLLGRKLAKPLMKMVESIKQDASGQIVIKDMQIASNDEIGTLARAFREMANKIQTLVNTLEDKVQERTAQLSKAKERMEHLAQVDYLTNIYNRRFIFDKLEQETRRCRQTQGTFAVIMADVDHFKTINDTYGHDCGDVVLKEVALTLQKNVKGTDFIARWGGEEFLLLLTDIGREDAGMVAERIRKAVEDNHFLYHNIPLKVTMTLGVALYRNGMDMDEVIKQADIAVYKGKARGRNRVEVSAGDAIRMLCYRREEMK